MNNVILNCKSDATGHIEKKTFIGGENIIRGRHPVARVEIFGKKQNSDIIGEASFYYTPLGVFICASVKGLDGNKGVYSLTLSEEDGEACCNRCAIPPLYDRNGYAWCSALTGKISMRELLGKKLTLRRLRAGVEIDEIASGVIRASRE